MSNDKPTNESLGMDDVDVEINLDNIPEKAAKEAVEVEIQDFDAEMDSVEEPVEEVVEEEEELPFDPSPTSNPNVELTKPFSGPFKANTPKPRRYLSVASGTQKDYLNLKSNIPNVDMVSGKQGREWYEVYDDALRSNLKADALLGALHRENSYWKQQVETEAGALAAGRPRFSTNSGGAALSGERAIMKASAVLGLGAIVQIPLWHSGIWISIKAPQDIRLYELHQRIANEKIALGRLSNGMIFSNSSIYNISYMVNFVLEHVYDATVKDISMDNLKSIIKVTDIPTLLWGMACAIYPNGYPYQRSCINPSGECQEVVRETLALSKLSWTDNRSLTDWQRKFMAKRNVKADDASLKRYQEEHINIGSRSIELNENLKMILDVPTIQQYEDSGFAWIDGIVRMMEDSFAVSLQGNQRNSYITSQGKLTSMRQYGHWVSKIIIGDEETDDDRETIEELVGLFSSDQDIADSFIVEVGRYIDDSTISLIAIPSYECPSCGYNQSEDSKHPYLITLDVAQIFFTLLDQRMEKVVDRDLTFF